MTERTLAAGPVGPFQIQAAIAAVHAEAPSMADTDWREITVLYELPERIAPNPIFKLNRAVALAMFKSPQDGLELLAEIEEDPRLARGHRLPAVRGHLLELLGESNGAVADGRARGEYEGSRLQRDETCNVVRAVIGT